MKKKMFFGRQFLFWILSLILFCSCSGEEKAIFGTDNDLITSFSYEWKNSIKNDTVILSCEQEISYQAAGESNLVLNPKAVVKFWVVKDTILFNKGVSPTPVYKTASNVNESNGYSPLRHTLSNVFEFEDGQNIIAEAMYESYSYSVDGVEKFLPYVDITSIDFDNASSSAISGVDNLFKAITNFETKWSVSNSNEKGAEDVSLTYIKKEIDNSDVIIKTEYNKGYKWIDDNKFSLYVQKAETWKIAGVKTQTFSSPELIFSLNGEKDKTLEVKSFNFNATQNSSNGDKENISNNDWTLKKTEVIKTISFSNDDNKFDDIFYYPLYEASYSVDGKMFEFDLSVQFSENHDVSTISETEAKNTTTAKAILLGRTFTTSVVTTFNKKTSTPEPDNKPNAKHGQILGYSVTAVFNVAGINNGEVTRKAVVIRYEQGYEWGICSYDEDFPKSMTYVQSGYTGFNSAAYDKNQKAYRIARAVDSADAIYWYAEDNSLVSIIDALTCKVYGWKHIVGGRYSAMISGYKAEYSDDKYTVTLTAPSGNSKTYSSLAE